MLDEAKLIRMTLHTPGRLVDGVGVNGVWVAHLESVLSSDQASEGCNDEGEDGTHVGGSVLVFRESLARRAGVLSERVG